MLLLSPLPPAGMTSCDIMAVMTSLANRADTIEEDEQQRPGSHLVCLKLGPPAECQQQQQQQQGQQGQQQQVLVGGWPPEDFACFLDWFPNHQLLQRLSVLELWGLSAEQQAEVRAPAAVVAA
jgi:hypothetical protein